MEWRLEQTGAGEDVESEIHGRSQHCLTFASILFLLVACVTGSIYVTDVGLANFSHTDKLPTDDIADRVSGKTCNLLKLIEDGGPMCRNNFKREIIEKPFYCYRTILQYTCYATLDPSGTGAQRIRKREPSSRRIQG